MYGYQNCKDRRYLILSQERIKPRQKLSADDLSDYSGGSDDLLTIRNLIKLDLGIFMYKSYNKLLPETAGEFHVPAEKVHPYGTRSAISGNIFLPRYDLSFT